MKKILIIAGETSSDVHASHLVKNILSIDKDISFFGLGGEKMAEAGVKLLYNITHLAFIGPAGLLKSYVKLKKIYTNLCEYTSENKPDCAILIDFAEFNLRAAEYLKKLNVPVIYYISPQVWAWGRWRIKTIKKLVDKIIVFFKFEEELYRKETMDVAFVGHPLLDMARPTRAREDVLKQLDIKKGSLVVGILPGSRKAEVENILPIMLKACRLLLNKNDNLKIEFVLALAPTIDEQSVKNIIDAASLDIKIIRDSTYDVLSICDSAMVASGTATLETAIMGVPMAIIYRTNFITYLAAKNLIKLPYIGIVNIIAGEKIVEEFLQYNARPERICDYVLQLLTDKECADYIKKKLAAVKNSLGESGASMRAAREVVDFLRKE